MSKLEIQSNFAQIDSLNISHDNKIKPIDSNNENKNISKNDNNNNNNNDKTNGKVSNNCCCSNLNNSDVNDQSHINNSNFDVSNPFELKYIDPVFEYKGYHKFSRILGKGSFGTVVECVRKKDNKLVALKLFKCKGISKWIPESFVINDLDDEIRKDSKFFSESKEFNYNRLLPLEVACLSRVNKLNNIVKLIDYIPPNGKNIVRDSCLDSCIDENLVIGIVLERDPSETSLFDYLLQNGCLIESEAKIIMKQVIDASLTLLNNGILHGDLKSENILIEPISKRIKLIDFGSSQFLESTILINDDNDGNTNTNFNKYCFNKCKNQSLLTKPVRTFRGTNLYKPPEFILHHCFYPRPSTVWTFGVILFDLVCGHFPFENDSDVLIHQEKDIKFSKNGLTEEFKDLIRKCLAFYVAERIVIEKILTHPWMNI